MLQRQWEALIAQGFDLTDSRIRSRFARPKCSQCEALVINGVACHESGCPNQMHECKGCNTLIPRFHRYCADCQ